MKKTVKTLSVFIFTLLFTLIFAVVAGAATTKNVGTVSKIKATQTDDTITLSWVKAENAKGYRIYEMISGKWVAMVTTKSTACILTDLSAGSEHTYAIKAYGKQNGKTVWGKQYKTIDTATRPSKIKKITTKSTENTVTLSWAKSTGAKGYRVYRYDVTSGGWKIIVNSTTKNSYTVKSLKNGESYTFAVKPYFKSGSQVYWASSYIKVTVKTVVNPTAKKIKIESSGFNSNTKSIILDISSDGWTSDFVGGSYEITVVVNGKNYKAPLKIPSSKNADGSYEVQIDLRKLKIASGITIDYIITEGVIKTKNGLQYNSLYKGSYYID